MSKKETVPITRDFLRQFCSSRPLPDPLHGPTFDQSTSSATKAIELALETVGEEDTVVIREKIIPWAKKIDENLFRNREQMEEIKAVLSVLKKKMECMECAKDGGEAKSRLSIEKLEKIDDLAGLCLERCVRHQVDVAEHVESQVRQLLPNDWRMRLMDRRRQSKEKKNESILKSYAESDEFTIRGKYDLLWNQQLARRAQLVELGNASGLFKWVLRHIAGVPQVLLDFTKTINDDLGPMEEMRIAYGPRMYALTKLANHIHVLLECLVPADVANAKPREVTDSMDSMDLMDLMDLALQLMEAYKEELFEFLDFLYKIFQDSPFFISPEEAASMRDGEVASKLTERKVPAGNVFTYEVLVREDNCELECTFTLDSKDIDFWISRGESEDESSGIFPKRRIRSGDGMQQIHVPVAPGTYSACWGNRHSMFTSKTIHYQVEVIPMQGHLDEDDVEEDKN